MQTMQPYVRSCASIRYAETAACNVCYLWRYLNANSTSGVVEGERAVPPNILLEERRSDT